MGDLCLKKAVPKTKQKEFIVFMAAAFSAFKKQGFVSTFWMRRKKAFGKYRKILYFRLAVRLMNVPSVASNAAGEDPVLVLTGRER